MGELLASPGVSGLFVQLEGREVGFALYRVVTDEAELLTIAVGRDHRRLGAGRALLRAVIAQVRADGARNLFLEVDADNAPAVALYSQAGFETVGRRAAYYQRPGMDAAEGLTMKLRLTSGE